MLTYKKSLRLKGGRNWSFFDAGGGGSPEPLDEPCKFFGLKLLGVWTSYGFKVNPLPPSPSPLGLKTPLKMNITLIFSETIWPIGMIS